MTENPNYYAIIPAKVRYDKTLNPYARLLYGEITALSNQKGYCWAANAYFAALYETSERSIQRLIKSLRDHGYITVEFEYAPGTKIISKRRIRLVDGAIFIPQKQSVPANSGLEVVTNLSGGGDKSVMHNTKFINTKNLKAAAVEKSAAHDPDNQAAAENIKKINELLLCALDKKYGITKLAAELPRGDDKSVKGGVTNLSEGGDKSVMHNTKFINTKNLKAAAVEKSAAHDPDNQAAAENIKKINALKAEFAEIDRRLVFDDSFYPRAAAFLSQNNFNASYILWLYKLCLRKNPKDITDFYFKLFFKEDIALRFAGENQQKAPAPPQIIPCPVCKMHHDKNDPSCPVCHFSRDDLNDDTRIKEGIAIFALPPDTRQKYSAEKNKVLENTRGFDLDKRLFLLRAVDKKYGIALEK